MVVYRSRRGVGTPAPVTSLQLHALACSTMRITISILCHYIPHYIRYHTSSELHALTCLLATFYTLVDVLHSPTAHFNMLKNENSYSLHSMLYVTLHCLDALHPLTASFIMVYFEVIAAH